MFKLRTEHQEAFFQAARAPFHRRILAFVRKTLPEKIAGKKDGELLAQIAAADKKATAHGMRTERAITQFVSLTFMAGLNFDQAPDVAPYFKLPAPDPDTKMNVFVRTLAAYKEQERKRSGLSRALGVGKKVLNVLLPALLYPFMPTMAPGMALGAEALGGAELAEAAGAVLAAAGPVGWGILAVAVVAVGAMIVYNEIKKVDEESQKEGKKDAPSDTNNCPKQGDEAKPADVDDVLKDAKPGKSSSTRQFEKPGGMDQADKDFDDLTRGSEVQDRGGGLRTATRPDGTKVTVRPNSTEGSPTVEIQPPRGGGRPIKVRYK